VRDLDCLWCSGFDSRTKRTSKRRGVFPGDKLVRRIRERREGVFRRFRVDHEPFEGYVAAEAWPDDRLCYEEIEVRLPGALGETVYEIHGQLVEETSAPQFCIPRFSLHRDSYAGARVRRSTCGTIWSLTRASNGGGPAVKAGV